MDDTLVNYGGEIERLPPEILLKYEGRLDEVPGIFSKMEPMPDAIESFKVLSEKFDTYILSTPPWGNPMGAAEKFDWVKHHLGSFAYKRLILSHHKHLNHGNFLVDDRKVNGAEKFNGELILFGSENFQNWRVVTSYLLSK